LAQLHPEQFSAALPMCGVVDGGIGQFNVMLDSMFAFNVLLANNQLQLVRLTDPNGTLTQAENVLSAAQQTPQGRARIALSNALEDRIGWVTPGSPPPAPHDYTTQEQNQFTLDQEFMVFHFPVRAEMEGRAGGNPSWNTGIDYAEQLEKSVDFQEVVALYKQAGLNLKQDLQTLNHSPRIKADPQAVNYMTRFIAFNGDLDLPVLTLHTVGDGLVFNQVEQAYASVVRSHGDANLLRETFVNRAGHCAFTSAEMITALHTLVNRVDSGRWDGSTDPMLMNNEAAQLGSSLNQFPPAFLRYQPAVFLRPFNAPD
jgi:hypothetical protein